MTVALLIAIGVVLFAVVGAVRVWCGGHRIDRAAASPRLPVDFEKPKREDDLL